MLNPILCKERILSEDYRDYIVTDTRTSFLSTLTPENICLQEAGYGYSCVYLPGTSNGPSPSGDFLYTSIPKCYAPMSMDALSQAGIIPIQNYPTLQLYGSGVLIGFIDSGIDYQNEIFRSLDGSTRIAAIWDQTVQTGAPPEGFVYGTEYTAETIDAALASEDPLALVPSTDETGHGTFTASLAAGSAAPQESFLGAAPEATIAMVKLKPAKQYLRDYYFVPEDAVCYQETDIILGLHYLDLLADRLGLPLVICIALGTNSGGHTGTLALPFLLNQYAASANRIPVIGSGNEADKRLHYFNVFSGNSDVRSVEIRVGQNVPGFTMELWTEIPNIVSISLTSPSGESLPPIPIRTGNGAEFEFLLERTRVSINYRLIVERETAELIFFRFSAPSPGIWRVNVQPVRVIDGRFHLWLPVSGLLDGDVFFLDSDPYYTIVDPGNTDQTITVSYYDGNSDSLSLSSGRGYSRSGLITPDLAAPGVNVVGALPGGRFVPRSGSSIAAAITSGAAALLMEWLIYQLGNPSIYTSQIKSIFILGAVRTPGMDYPNREWGYGRLNLYNSFDEIRRF